LIHHREAIRAVPVQPCTSVRSKVIEGTLWAFVARLVTIISGVILTLVLARYLHPATYGLVFLAISVINLSAIFSDCGIGSSVSRFIAEYSAAKQSYLRNIIKTGLVYKTASGIIVTAVIITFATEISSFLSHSQLRLYLIIGGFAVFFKPLIDFSSKVFQGFQELKYAAIVAGLRDTAILILVLGPVVYGYGGVGAIYGYTVSYMVVGTVGLLIIFKKFYTKLPRSENYINRDILRYAFPLMLINASFLIYTEMDTLMIAYFWSSDHVAFYRVPKEIIRMITMPAAAIGAALAPALAYAKSGKSKEEVHGLVFRAHTANMAFCIPASIGISMLAGPIITLMFGDSYSESVIPLQLMSIYLLFFSVALIVSPCLDYLGHASVRSRMIITASLSNFALNLLLIPQYGAVGAIVSTLVTYSVYVSLNVRILWREMGMNRQQFMAPIYKGILASVVMVVYLLVARVYIYNVQTLLAVSIGGCLIYFPVAAWLGIIPARMLRMFGKIQSMR